MRSSRHIILLLVSLGISGACGQVPNAAPAEADGGATDGAGSDVPAVDGRRDAGALPEGLIAIDDFTYLGAFRVASAMYGPSRTDYATGALGYRPDHRSLYLAGFAPDAMICELAIPDVLGTGTDVAALPVVDEALQDFAPVLDASGNPEAMDTVTGMLWADGDLIVNANVWYDAPGTARDTTLVVRGGDLSGAIDGWFELEGAALAAGYMAPVPAEWQSALGGTALTGWASNYSIVSRYSVGPSLFSFDPMALLAPGAPVAIPTTMHLGYPYADGVYLAPDALEYQCRVLADMTSTECDPGARASDLWNFVSRGVYAFIVPGTRTFAVLGRLGGSETGIGYKITQDDGTLCGGPCARGAGDYHNQYWLYDLDTIVGASSPSAPQPYAYGRWSVPFDDGGAHSIIGGALAPETGVLYLALSHAGQVGEYDRPPVIVAYDVTR